MKTYQDLIEVGLDEKNRAAFVLSAIGEHRASEEFSIAEDAKLYYNQQNPTIMRFQKFVYDRFGKAVPDIWSANNKIASNWYNYFTTQSVSYLLGNGVSFKKKDTSKKLGKNFDKKLQDALTSAKGGSVSFGFWNKDHLMVFDLTEFVPIYDEENGSLRAGVRFWQVSPDKPLRATLYEEDGYTDYIKKKDEEFLNPLNNSGKRPYILKIKKSDVDGTEIYDGRNYPKFPIVPLWNVGKVSDLERNRGTIDAYDLMISGLINNVSDGEFIYWILQNCNGMSEADDAKFIEQLKLTHVAHADNDDGTGAKVDSHQATVPFEASAEALDRLKDQLYHDFMALNVETISAAATNDQIQAAYEPINQKTDQIEYQVTEFIGEILELAGIDDTPSYTRSQMSNRKETIELVLSAAQHLDSQYVTEKILSLLGDADKADEVIKRMQAEETNRFEDGAEDGSDDDGYGKEEEGAEGNGGDQE